MKLGKFLVIMVLLKSSRKFFISGICNGLALLKSNVKYRNSKSVPYTYVVLLARSLKPGKKK
jgi:hypothetical protein